MTEIYDITSAVDLWLSETRELGLRAFYSFKVPALDEVPAIIIDHYKLKERKSGNHIGFAETVRGGSSPILVLIGDSTYHLVDTFRQHGGEYLDYRALIESACKPESDWLNKKLPPYIVYDGLLYHEEAE